MTSGEINNWVERFTVRAAIQKKNKKRMVTDTGVVLIGGEKRMEEPILTSDMNHLY
jgi:hypothetical protein